MAIHYATAQNTFFNAILADADLTEVLCNLWAAMMDDCFDGGRYFWSEDLRQDVRNHLPEFLEKANRIIIPALKGHELSEHLLPNAHAMHDGMRDLVLTSRQWSDLLDRCKAHEAAR